MLRRSSFVLAILFASFANAASLTQSVFATGKAVRATGPDSITTGNGSVWVAYSNGADSTGLSGSSVVVQYNKAGGVLHQYSLAGYVDGLKFNPSNGDVWALQNQDGNSTLTIIHPSTMTTTGPIFNAVTSSTRVYDDVVFKGGGRRF